MTVASSTTAVDFRSADGSTPPALGGFLTHLGTISALTLPADNGTWSVTLVTSAKDKALRVLHDPAIWESAVRSLPLQAHWLDGQPIDDRVMSIAGIEDRHRNLMVEGVPVATGVVAAGDAWACSNPTVGRAPRLGRCRPCCCATQSPGQVCVIRGSSPVRSITPQPRRSGPGTGTRWWLDCHRLAEIDALIGGGEYRPDDPGWRSARPLPMPPSRTLTACGVSSASPWC